MLPALMLAALLAAPGEATAALKARDAELRAALPPAGAAVTPEVRARLEAILARALDVPAMVESAMAARWAKLTAPQKKRLLAAFDRKLRHAAGEGLEDYRSSAVAYGAEEARPGGLVRVPTTVSAKGESSQVAYTLRPGKGGWRIVDVTVDGVSTVENYRASFARIISKDGVEALLQKLERADAKVGAQP